jgi:hypothetical protein
MTHLVSRRFGFTTPNKLFFWGLFMMIEKGLPIAENVVPFQPKKTVPSLKELLKDKDVAEFYRFVAEKDFRLRAIELLSNRISKMTK